MNEIFLILGQLKYNPVWELDIIIYAQHINSLTRYSIV